MRRKSIHSAMDMEERAMQLGFLPFFPCGIPGFSIEEMVAPELWFSDQEDGPWEWKGPVIKEGHCAYGKFFNRKAGYVSLEWLPDLMNYRRSKPLAYNDDIAALDDIVLQTIEIEGSATIKELRQLLSFAKGRGKRKKTQETSEQPLDEKISLEPILVRLMMELRLVISDFEYNIDRHGRPYGWGIARYATPESLYGPMSVDRTTPQESFNRILEHFKKLFPDAPEKILLKLIG